MIKFNVRLPDGKITMKKYLLIFGWFFAFQHSYGLEDAKVRGVVGPFTSQAICEMARVRLISMFEYLGTPEAEVQEKCVERQDI